MFSVDLCLLQRRTDGAEAAGFVVAQRSGMVSSDQNKTSLMSWLNSMRGAATASKIDLQPFSPFLQMNVPHSELMEAICV